MNETRNLAGANIGNLILGIWVVISPFVLGFSGIELAKWNDIAVGGAVALLGLGRGPQGAGARFLNVLLGIWLVASPFVLGFAGAVAVWNSIILGIVIVIVALIAGDSGHTVKHSSTESK